MCAQKVVYGFVAENNSTTTSGAAAKPMRVKCHFLILVSRISP